ncbi:lactoylglutathione lyase [Spirochaetia bacterium]|nr:lactoylglutathione lyase [Spirochaetia bacterium]
MQISHIAIYVDNLNRMDKFYEKYFGAKSKEIYFNPKTGLQSYLLSFDDGCILEIMTKPALTKIENRLDTIGYNHIAICVGGKGEVDRITTWLKEEGHKIINYPHTAGDGCYESLILDPENNLIEIRDYNYKSMSKRQDCA